MDDTSVLPFSVRKILQYQESTGNEYILFIYFIVVANNNTEM